MNRCLNERSFLRIYTREGTAAERSHLRLCADCAERYEQLVEDLELIGRVLAAPPPVPEGRRVLEWRAAWKPVALAAAALIVVSLGVARVRRSSPEPVALSASKVSAFTVDLSNALFATGDPNAVPGMVADAAYLDAALDAGHPCTADAFMAGDCDDQLSAVMIESD